MLSISWKFESSAATPLVYLWVRLVRILFVYMISNVLLNPVYFRDRLHPQQWLLPPVAILRQSMVGLGRPLVLELAAVCPTQGCRKRETRDDTWAQLLSNLQANCERIKILSFSVILESHYLSYIPYISGNKSAVLLHKLLWPSDQCWRLWT